MEDKHSTAQDLENAVRLLINHFDENPDREGLKETPKRHVKYLKDFITKGEPPFKMTTFDPEGYNEWIIQKGIDFHSLCEHHLLPFYGTVTLGYLPENRIVGLSKLSRVVEHYAHRFQNQERITKQVCEFLFQKLKCKGVFVKIEAVHFCMCMRGVKQHNVPTSTFYKSGIVKDINIYDI